MPQPNLSALGNCVEDVRSAVVDGDVGPADPTDFHSLRGRLVASRTRLPPLYRQTVLDPYKQALESLGVEGFTQILIQDPNKEGAAGLMMDLAHAVLQNGEGYEELATDGFQEVVSDLYDGFLNAEDRRGVEPPDQGIVAPLVKWGNPLFGPYTFTRMLALLKPMHDANPSWGPLFVAHPSSVSRHGGYER